MTTLSIDGRLIGEGAPPYLIAELSGNHNGSKDRAIKLLEAAAGTGVDAIKIQTYTADTLTIEHSGDDFMVKDGLWSGRTLHELYQEAHTPWEWHEDLFIRGRELGITVFSSPFDNTAVDFLETLGCPAYKIASFEAMDLPLVRKAAFTGKPLIVSTGMVAPTEIDELLTAVNGADASSPALLHCVSAYPAPVNETNLMTIPAMIEQYDTVIGLSDHTPGTTVAVAAVALGAAIIEKHLCLARADGGVDSAFSLEPAEMAKMVKDCRTAWEALGTVHLGSQASSEGSLVFRRSLYITEDVKAGELLNADNVRSIRPGYGLAPKFIDEVIGKRARCDLTRGTPLSWDLIAGASE